MRRTGVIVLAPLVALALLSGCGRGAPATAPACLPHSFDVDATLPGTSVSVSPAPNSGTANPHTQISFLGGVGGPPIEIREVSADGSRTGLHQGRMESYSQGDGASFLPSRPFDAGERVTVRAVVAQRGTARRVAFAFDVDTPYPTGKVPPFPNPAAGPSEYQSFRTLPALQAPILTVTTPDRDPGAGDILMTNGPGPGRYGALIYTPAGRLVWFEQLSHGLSAENLSVQSFEGSHDLTLWEGKVLSLGFGQGRDLVLNSHYQTVATVTGGNGLAADLHDFQIAPHDVAYTTAFNPIRCDLSGAGGARDGVVLDAAVQETDMRTGLIRWEWHALDHVAVGESETTAPHSSGAWDWFHLNSIDPEPDDEIFISARSTWAGYQLDGRSGRILWRLGGSKSSFHMGPGARTAWQHDGRVLPDGEVTFFDNGANPPIHSASRAVRIALDLATHTASLRSSFTHPGLPLLSASQGNVQTLGSGNSVVGYGLIGAVSEYDPSGGLLFDAHLPLDETSYRAFRFPWSGRPTSPPVAAANLNNTSEETIVYASWNGATGVAAWRVLAGAHPTALAARATVPASGFESSAILPAQYAYAAVQALGPDGRVLAGSPPVGVRPYAASFAGGAG
ncbi:MAG: arylsulfotransferase family protein [Solirubrobacterales bacterium]|nr:arylsulfotransferase family protein [Solirubrobacterales bacterium]